MAKFSYRYGFIEPVKELQKIRKLMYDRPDLRFTTRNCPFRFYFALDRDLIEPSGKHLSIQLKDGGVTQTEYKFKVL